MNVVRSIAGIFQDSPTSGLDRAKLVSGFTIGTTGLLLNAAVFIFVLPLMADPDDWSLRQITENLEFRSVAGSDPCWRSDHHGDTRHTASYANGVLGPKNR